MKPLFFALILLSSVLLFTDARSKPAPVNPKATIAFWNVENLFDTINDPNTNDEDFLPEGKLKWTSQRYTDKLNKLSKGIISLAGGAGPDLIGLGEIENRRVLEDLTKTELLKNQNYGIVHYDSPDKRGVDVALLYKKKSFNVLESRTINVSVPADTFFTRDILLVKGILNKKDTMYIFVNHWPSRRGGKEQSDEKRQHASDCLRAAADSVLKLNPLAEILAMGDFNDEPTDPSIEKLSAFSRNSVSFFNLMDSLKLAGEGSYHYKKEKNLIDQILVTKTLMQPRTYAVGLAEIFKQDWLTGINYKDDPPGPLHTYAGSRYIGGASDHYPVFVDLNYYPVK